MGPDKTETSVNTYVLVYASVLVGHPSEVIEGTRSPELVELHDVVQCPL